MYVMFIPVKSLEIKKDLYEFYESIITCVCDKVLRYL